MGNTAGKVDVTSNGSITTGSAGAPSDNAIGIEAQSIGGGGGNGGFSLSVAAALDSFAIGIGKAGSGGEGGTSDTVNVTSNGTIETFGKLSYGILAQSIGGGGGNGGFAISGAFSESGSGMGNAIGGDGGGGNTGGAVTVTTNATATSTIPGTVISTHGLGAVGILAQSIGGGGGNGGFAIDLNVSIEGGAGDDVSSVLGATGAVAGGGGDASNGLIVTVNNNGGIATTGAAAHGVLAQSIGGGGGNGGFAIAGSFSNDSDASSNAIGGKGGAGGAGGQVIVNNKGDIAVGGDAANAIVAQSIGGGGGGGGFSIGAALSLGGKAASNSLGDGGLSSEVDVFNANKITVGGAHAAGILAQSVGGGGGNGGFTIGAGISVSDSDGASDTVGGSGGKGGQGGIVKVTTSAGSSITTSGFMDYGIEAQSIGGGGGNGGFAISGTFSDGGDAKSSIGGQDKNADCKMTAGCGGGASLMVTVDNAGGVETLGANSVGILAQSIGGGGAGGFAASASLSLNGSVASNSVGGAGGDGGVGGEVEVTNQASALIHTVKDNSTGVIAQSIGGGGGNGGFSIGAGLSLGAEAAANTVGGSGGKGGSSSEVDVTNLGAIFADGAHSTGILAQSIGGGGGNGGFTIGAAGSTGGNGASDSVGGNGGVVKVVNGPGALIVTGGAMDYGIQAQSIGGGGGNGGFVVAGSFSSGGDASSKIGGDCNANCTAHITGGGGGFAMQVTVENSGLILTGGASSIGILAQSIGGGGGSGGFSGGLAFSASGGATSNSVGGSGGAGGAGGAVTVINHVAGVIHTEQANSTGIMAQSIGGGGGNGAFSFSGGVGGGGSGVSQSVGGTGGKGGAGALVTVQNDGAIQTDAALSYGIYAQSIGGGGGAGGISVSGAYSSSGGATSTVGGQGAAGGGGGEVKVTNTGSILVKGAGSVGIYAQSVGGGGAGGAGGNVTVISTGSIETLSADSVAVIAQSIGGGGGSGAFAISAQDGALDGSTLQIGGSGAATQGVNGNVIVDISGGDIVTAGDLSYGLLSQAIGGGGGNGALSVPDPLTIGILGSTQMVGASGSIVGDGNPLDAKNANSIGTTGAGALGYVGQSIGGGGGTSGVTGDVTFTAAGPLKLVVGGSSSGGGSGGIASVTNTAALIVTGGDLAVPASGDPAAALLAQSIGGGGGSAVYALGVVQGMAGPVSLTLGGSEGGVDNGGLLTLTTGGDVVTQGRFAPGVIGQTIGGGGGFGAVTASSGLSASGVLFSLGSTGGSGGSADPTGASTWTIGGGNIVTSGLLSDALVAQAIGAGGGLAGFVSDGAQKPPLAGAILGAGGAAVGNGSVVTLINSSSLSTTGTGALGIIAQSIGGGGGAAQAYGLSGSGIITLGASGGASGDGKLVSVTSSGSIRTIGDGAHGILAQSVGGGGGFFAAFDGPLLSPTVQAGAGGGGGAGGGVTVLVQGEINTTGAGAHGVIAQSVGGGGGLVGAGQFATTLPTAGSFAGSVGGVGAAGVVTVDATASIFAMGADSTGIVAASTDASGRGGSINVGVATGVAIVGGLGVGGTPGHGDEPANAVRFIGGAANMLSNHGILTTGSGIDGFTVTGGLGDDAIDNFGHMDGSIDLSAGANALHNEATTDKFMATGVFNSGAVVWLGGANLLTNDGLMSPGAYLNVLTTNVTGNFLQSATGVYGLDLELKNQTADRINVLQTAGVGGKATVGGRVNINILNPGLALPGGHVVTIVHAEGGETHPGLGLTYVPSAVANYGLSFTPTDINLDYAIDFSPSGLTVNEHAVGYAINNIQVARISPAFTPIASALFYQPTVAALGAVYDSISGEGVSGFEQTAFGSNDLFLTSVGLQTDFWLSDRTADASGKTVCEHTVLTGSALHVAPNGGVAPPPCERSWRAWFAGYGGNSRVAGEYPLGSAKLKDNNSGVSAGLDYQLTQDVLLGVAGGAGSSGFNVSARETSGSLQTGHVALYGAGRAGAFYATGVVAYDFSNVHENRFAAIPGSNQPIVPTPSFAEHLAGDFGADSVSGRLEAGWRSAYAGVNITPFGAFQFSSLNMHGFSETADRGPSVIGLTFSDRSVASLPSFLGVKLESGGFVLPGDSLLSASLRVSWMHEFSVWRPVTASFLAAPGFDFTVYGAKAPRDSARVNAGFKLDLTPNMALFGNFLGDFSGKGQALAGSGGVRIAW
ncbi:hypothetical protein [Methylocapsa palsarum]|uniref:Uncharacterized conserved protein, contains a C-terminal beta-barrel porin domain n=1 Tax=Methylocapsa palsarum TaxID=1612308 RepID=A0A1I4BPZ0_9HYPH|nr:hypothetical protein [Methylocapsa palsarum]SFK70874.1 Uncharacterized conserved protein, contains a C-terminal beta-barrel porin domain [Methylocapsa palsarum]